MKWQMCDLAKLRPSYCCLSHFCLWFHFLPLYVQTGVQERAEAAVRPRPQGGLPDHPQVLQGRCLERICPKRFVSFARRDCIYCPKGMLICQKPTVKSNCSSLLYKLPGHFQVLQGRCLEHICQMRFVSFARRDCIYCPKGMYLLPEAICKK